MIEKLKSLLTPETPFKEIAEMLFQNFHIEKGDIRYDFLEIEYYSSLTDENEKSGVDIAFKSDEKQYGGILIRSLLKTQNNRKEFIAGPLRCSCELFNGLLNVNGDTAPLRLVEHVQEKKNIEYTIRQGIVSDKKSNKEFCAYLEYDINSGWRNGTDYYNAKPWERK